MLDQALKHGLILNQVHWVIECYQLAWLRPYIDFNIKLRAKAKTEFKKDFFKLINNSVFGKMMKNIRKHENIKLTNNYARFWKLLMKPNFKFLIEFGLNLIASMIGKVKVVLNELVYLGQAILDLSKLVMYEFHYDYMKPKYGDNLKRCYKDTNSLIYHIHTEDWYRDIAPDVKDKFDMSNHNPANARPLSIGLNKKEVGIMNDELGGKIMMWFARLRSKSYAYEELDGTQTKRCKGVKK